MNTDDVLAASRLLQNAMSNARPTKESEYRSLLDRYQIDTSFAKTVAAVSEGLGLRILSTSPLGLIVAGATDGPFRLTLENSGLSLRSTAEARLQDRLLLGLALVGIAAYAYPNAASLSSSNVPTVRPADIERALTRNAEAIVRANSTTDDGGDARGDLDEQLSSAAKHWLTLPEILLGGRDKLRRECRRWYVETMLGWLVDQGRARKESALSETSGDLFSLNDRFRVGLVDIAETLAFRILAANAAEESRSSGPSNPGGD